MPSGHSGVEIHKAIVNPIVLLNQTLTETLDATCLLADFVGGTKRNLIPARAAATLWVAPGREEEIKAKIEASWARNASAMFPDATKGNLSFSSPDATKVISPLSADDAARICAGLRNFRHGVIAMSEKVPGLVATSNNLATLEVAADSAQVLCLARSSMPGAGESFTENIYFWTPKPSLRLSSRTDLSLPISRAFGCLYSSRMLSSRNFEPTT